LTAINLNPITDGLMTSHALL